MIKSDTMFPRTLLFLLLIIISVALRTPAQTFLVTLTSATPGIGNGMRSQGHILVAQPEKETFKTGEPIILRLALSNHSDEEIYVIEQSPTKDNEVDVKNARGAKVPLSEKGQKRLDSPVLRRFISRIGPGQTVQYQIAVDELYDLAADDTYTVIVKRTILMQDKKTFARVESNPVMLRVK